MPVPACASDPVPEMALDKVVEVDVEERVAAGIGLGGGGNARRAVPVPLPLRVGEQEGGDAVLVGGEGTVGAESAPDVEDQGFRGPQVRLSIVDHGAPGAG